MSGASRYEAVIGLEIHVQLRTKSKMFCRCDNQADGAKPNELTCPVCLGLPGALPVPNRTAVEWAIKAALALGCAIPDESKFDRKQYFYPDLPKGYQISQYDQPFGGPGTFEFDMVEDGKTVTKQIGITRLHLEEDAGKLTHPKGADYSLVDLNRAGTPLAEIVTEPDLRSPAEAKRFLQELRRLMRYLGISDADMEKGHLRADANISLRKPGEKKLGTKTELKNLNSFRFVERGLAAEIERQTELLDAGKSVDQETRGFDEDGNRTVSQRGKEEAHDYRYFPEPDIPPLEPKALGIKKLVKGLPELPVEVKRRFITEYGLQPDQAELLTDSLDDVEYFEASLKAAMSGKNKINDRTKAAQNISKIAYGIGRQIMTKKMLNSFMELDWPGSYPSVTGVGARYLASGEYTMSTLNPVMERIWEEDLDPEKTLEKEKPQKLGQSDLDKIIDQAIADNPKPAADFKAGNENAKQVIVGAVMKATKGAANAREVAQLVEKKLS
ncbi:MAG TPA: Asp-tRNA(Asn)/Glu-tRNA(Gln) amidotransferase subunit GatB [Patescibacteria group bacterium]